MARTVLLGLLASSLLGGLNAHAAGPVWAIRGAHNTVYLAGSVHLLPVQDSALPPAFERAYRDSSRLVMELDLGKVDQMAAANWITVHGALPAGTDLRSVIGAPRYLRVSVAAQEVGLPGGMLDNQAPWVVALELADLEYVHMGFDPEAGVEAQLLRHAQSDGRPTAGLESIDEELGGLEALSRADQLRMLDLTLDELKDTPSETQEVLSAWRHGDATRLAQLLSREYQSFPALYQFLVSARNKRWLPEIEELLQRSDNSLVVVGSLHLVGEGGLLELLRKDGLTPVQLE
ncbi:MAG TPA: TraB/GumN family protein [Steroidobacteraceae bacterium]|nr:TraB/GumN family protein [Steroidobacteraceae bacterium]